MSIQGLFQNTTAPMLEQVVNYGQMRHNILAGNIANISTPGYEFRDLAPAAFQSLLKGAVASGKQGGAAPAKHVPGAELFGLAPSPKEDPFNTLGPRIQDSLTIDSSNRSLEYQVAEITKNQMQHNIALAVLTSQYRLLQAAISEQV